MNSYNQKRNSVDTITKYNIDGKDSTYWLLIEKFKKEVQKKIYEILIKEKKFSENESNIFISKLFNIDYKRKLEIFDKIENCYLKGKTIKECAKNILDDYYKITLINKYDSNIDDNENVEIHEKLNENSNYKQVSKSMFWNFIRKIKKLDIKFILDTVYVDGINNSLNTNNYILFLETQDVDIDVVKYEFKYGESFSNILNYLDNEKNDKLSFYIGIKKNSELYFGFVFNDKKYVIGYINYKSTDFYKLINLIIKTDKDINLIELFKKIKSKTQILYSINKNINYYLQNYDNINIYNNIIDNNYTVIVESLNNDIINKNYIEKIIEKIYIPKIIDYEIIDKINNNKIIYYIMII